MFLKLTLGFISVLSLDFCTAVTIDPAVFDPFSDPCYVRLPKATSGETAQVTAPTHCTNGTFNWDTGPGYVYLSFANPRGHNLQVCLLNYIFGGDLIIHDVTGTSNMLLVLHPYKALPDLHDKVVCSQRHQTKITLSIQARVTTLPEVAYWLVE